MKIWRVYSVDHRLMNEASEGDIPELYDSSEGGALKGFAQIVRDSVGSFADHDDPFYKVSDAERHEPVEVHVTIRETRDDITPRELVLACLNGRGWAQAGGGAFTIKIDVRGRILWRTRRPTAASS